MSLLTLTPQGGKPLAVLRGEISFPRLGIWSGDLEVDTDQPLAGKVTLDVSSGAITWQGFVLRAGVFAGKTRARVLGGAGGLVQTLVPKYHHGVPFRLPFTDILTEVGEALSASADAATLATLLPAWVRFGEPAGDALSRLADLFEVSWRVLGDGSVWIGPELLPPYADPFQVMAQDDAGAWAEIATDLPTLVPGVTLGGRPVGRVVHRFEADRVRTVAWFER